MKKIFQYTRIYIYIYHESVYKKCIGHIYYIYIYVHFLYIYIYAYIYIYILIYNNVIHYYLPL